MVKRNEIEKKTTKERIRTLYSNYFWWWKTLSTRLHVNTDHLWMRCEIVGRYLPWYLLWHFEFYIRIAANMECRLLNWNTQWPFSRSRQFGRWLPVLRYFGTCISTLFHTYVQSTSIAFSKISKNRKMYFSSRLWIFIYLWQNSLPSNFIFERIFSSFISRSIERNQRHTPNI